MASPRWLPRNRVGLITSRLNSAIAIPQMTTKKNRSCRNAIAPLPGSWSKLESLPERLDDPLRDRGEQHHEAPEDERVEHAGERPAEQTPLRDHVHEERAHARDRMIEATLRARGAPHHAEQLSPAQSARIERRAASRTSAIGLRIAVTPADTSVPSTPPAASAGTPRCPPAASSVPNSADELAAAPPRARRSDREMRARPHRSLGRRERKRSPSRQELSPATAQPREGHRDRPPPRPGRSPGRVRRRSDRR